MENIRRATKEDASRIAEIEIFNYRLNFYPIFLSDDFYFGDLQVVPAAERLCAEPELLENTCVYDDGVVKGFLRMDGTELKKLFVEPALQGKNIGAKLLEYAVGELGANSLWALEKNVRAVAFYQRHGFHKTNERKLEEDTAEYLVRMTR